MIGIVSYGVSIPYYRLQKATAAQAFGKRAGSGEKAVAYCDEDSVTLAVAAAREAMFRQDVSGLKGIYFASCTAPYAEKTCATQIGAALDAPAMLRSCDFANSLRAGSEAILAASDAISAGGTALVTMSDCRQGAADGKFETDLGDAAGAFLLGSENILASLDGSVSVSKDAIDQWRADDDLYLRDWDVRYANNRHYVPLVTQAVRKLLAQQGTTSADYRWIVLYGHEEKNRAALVKKLGFQPEQVAPSFFGQIGNTGNAAAAVMLASVLDQAQPGDKILFVTYGDGCDAMALTMQQASGRQVVAPKMARKDNSLPYGKYLKWKSMIDCEPQKRPAQERSALPDYDRNYRKNHSLWGSRCTACGTPVFPPQRVCVHCHAIDQMEPYQFLDKKGYVRTFTMDGLSLSLDSPNILVVVEFEGGGKMMTYLVDCKKEDVKVGMAVTPTFRKMYEANGVQTYFWKVVPADEEVSA